MNRTVIDQSGQNWLQSEAYDDDAFINNGSVPLDDQMGAGALNAQRAVKQLAAGQFKSGAGVPMIGWDYGQAKGINNTTNIYKFNRQLPEGSFVSVMLAYDRKVEFDTDGGTAGVFDPGDTFQKYVINDPAADDVISDLDLYLMPRGATNLKPSESAIRQR
jgi:hypothetical protein